MYEAEVVVFAGGILAPEIRVEQLIELERCGLPILKVFGFNKGGVQSLKRIFLLPPAQSFLAAISQNMAFPRKGSHRTVFQ